METALFFRKCPNQDEYFKLANNYPDFGNNLNFVIDTTVVLTESDYQEFTSNFLTDNEVIIKIKNELFMDENDLVHCAYFTIDGSYGFLVYSSGYDYARYVAYYESGFRIKKGG